MSKKAKEIQLQSELETTEEFEEMLGREGLTGILVWLQDAAYISLKLNDIHYIISNYYMLSSANNWLN